MLDSRVKSRELPSERSIELLRQNLPVIGISIPIKESDVEDIHWWFVSTELELAECRDAGKEINENYLKDIMAAADELQPLFDDIPLDIEYLNKRLVE